MPSELDDLFASPSGEDVGKVTSPSSDLDDLFQTPAERPNQQGVSEVDRVLGTAGVKSLDDIRQEQAAQRIEEPPKLPENAPAFDYKFEQPSTPTQTQNAQVIDAAEAPKRGPITKPTEALALTAFNYASAPLVAAGSAVAGGAGVAEDLISNPRKTIAESWKQGVNNLTAGMGAIWNAPKGLLMAEMRKVYARDPKTSALADPNVMPLTHNGKTYLLNPRNPEDIKALQMLESIDDPRLAASIKAAKEHYELSGLVDGPLSALKMGGIGLLQSVAALGDFLLINRIVEHAGRSARNYYDNQPELQLGNRIPVDTPYGKSILNGEAIAVANAIPKAIAETAAELIPGVVPVEGGLLTFARMAPKALYTNVERMMPTVLKASGANKVYAAGVDFYRSQVQKNSFAALAKSSRAGVDEVDTVVSSTALQQSFQAASTTPVPLPIKRVAAQAEAAVEATVGQVDTVAKKAGFFKRSWQTFTGKDQIENVMQDVTAPILKLQQHTSIGRGEARVALHKNFMMPIFGQDLDAAGELARVYLSGMKGYVRTLMATLPEGDKKALADAFGWTPEQVQSAWEAAIKNKPYMDPNIDRVGFEAARVLNRAPEVATKLQDLTDKYTIEEMGKLHGALVDASRPGYVSKDLVTEATTDVRGVRVTHEQIAQARLSAWNRAWKEFTDVDKDGKSMADGLRAHLDQRYSGDKGLTAATMKSIDEYMKFTRRELELHKLKSGYTLREGLYVHHMNSTNTVAGVMGEAMVGKKKTPGSKRQREGKVDLDTINLWDSLQKDMTEVFAAKAHDEAWSELMGAGIIRGKGPKDEVVDGLLYRHVKRDDGVMVKQPVKGYREVNLATMDKYTLRKVMAINPMRWEQAMTQKVMGILDQAGSGRSFVNSLDELMTSDTLSTDQATEVLALMKKNPVFAREDVWAYLQSMRKSNSEAYKLYLAKSVQEDRGFKDQWSLAQTELTGSERVFESVRLVNAVRRPIAVGMDVAGLSQRAAIYYRVFSEYGPAALVEVIWKSQRLVDPAFLETYSKLLRNGGVYEAPKGLNELRLASDGRAFEALGIMHRHMTHSERVMYGNSWANLGFDTRMRVAVNDMLEGRIQQFRDYMASDPGTKKMYTRSRMFLRDAMLGNGSWKKAMKNGQPDPMAIAKEIKSIMGDYNMAARTDFEKNILANTFMFYGWHRGTFFPVITAPFRHPVWAAAAPLYLLDELNYALNEKHLWENEPGHKFDIGFKINGKQYYVSPPNTFRKAFRVGLGEDLGHIVEQAISGRWAEARALMAAYALQAPANAGLSWGRQNVAVNLPEGAMRLYQYFKSHEWDENSVKALAFAFSQLNYQGADALQEFISSDSYQGVEPAFLAYFMLQAGSLYIGHGISGKGGSPTQELQNVYGRQGGGLPPMSLLRAAQIEQMKMNDNRGPNAASRLVINKNVGEVLEGDLVGGETPLTRNLESLRTYKNTLRNNR